MIEQMLHDKNCSEIAISVSMTFMAIFMRSFMLLFAQANLERCM